MRRFFSGKRDVYLDVAERYEQFIKLGVLKEGEKLPSVRTVAGELGVNPNTVQKAYAHLETLGLVCSVPKKGVFVRGKDLEISRKNEIIEILGELKSKGVSSEEIIDALKEVYEND